MLVNLLLEKRRTHTRSLLEDDETSQSQHSFPCQIEALGAMLQFRFIANRKGVITCILTLYHTATIYSRVRGRRRR